MEMTGVKVMCVKVTHVKVRAFGGNVRVEVKCVSERGTCASSQPNSFLD